MRNVVSDPPAIRTASEVEMLDWMEVSCFLSRRGCFTFDELLSASEIEIESDHGRQLSDIDTDADSLSLKVDSEVRSRETELGEAYPFVYSDRGTLSLRANWQKSPSHVAYLFCLLVGSAVRGGVLQSKLANTSDLRNARGLFQIVATVATAGIVGGPTYSLGYPRPDRSRLHTKLRSVWTACRDGVVRLRARKIRRKANDAGIDVIAWEPRPDRVRIHRIVAFGQAATGADYRDKPFLSDIDAFLDDWFSTRPRAQIEAWTLVPFLVQTTEAKRWRHHLGALAGRQIVALRVGRGMALATDGIIVEQARDWPKVRRWVTAVRKKLRS